MTSPEDSVGVGQVFHPMLVACQSEVSVTWYFYGLVHSVRLALNSSFRGTHCWTAATQRRPTRYAYCTAGPYDAGHPQVCRSSSRSDVRPPCVSVVVCRSPAEYSFFPSYLARPRGPAKRPHPIEARSTKSPSRMACAGSAANTLPHVRIRSPQWGSHAFTDGLLIVLCGHQRFRARGRYTL